MVDTINNDVDVVVVPIEEGLGVKAFSTIIINFDGDGIDEYDEMVTTLHGKGSYNYDLKKRDLDLKNRSTPPARPSIKKPPILELKASYLTCDMYSWGQQFLICDYYS